MQNIAALEWVASARHYYFFEVVAAGKNADSGEVQESTSTSTCEEVYVGGDAAAHSEGNDFG